MGSVVPVGVVELDEPVSEVSVVELVEVVPDVSDVSDVSVSAVVVGAVERGVSLDSGLEPPHATKPNHTVAAQLALEMPLPTQKPARYKPCPCRCRQWNGEIVIYTLRKELRQHSAESGCNSDLKGRRRVRSIEHPKPRKSCPARDACAIVRSGAEAKEPDW